jgi:DNA repair exonuclease SbcCD nuclease subunit
MNSRLFIKISLSVILLVLTIIPSSALLSGSTMTYSIVHISDTQNLASGFPETYDYTFTYLDSIKSRYNISAIIITGDLVNTWDSAQEWDAYSHAIRKTSIPVYVIAGNHDTNNGENYQYYTQNTGNSKNSYLTRLENFDLVGINYVPSSLDPQEFAALRKPLIADPENFTIIATHYYMDTSGTLSPLGTDIDRQLIVKPTIVLAGHMHGELFRVRNIDAFPIIEDLSNYQDGIPGVSSNENVSAGRLYTVTIRNDQVEKISSQVIWISPRQSFGGEQLVYDIAGPSAEEPGCNSTSGVCAVPAAAATDNAWTSFWEFLKRLFRIS